MAFAGRYGLHRDELYFLAAGRRLDWGYDDQPALVPALTRLADVVTGGSPYGIRLPAALAFGATVLLAGLLAREFGGGPGAQALAAAAWATAPATLIAAHMVTTTVFDQLGWTLIAYLLVRWHRTRRDRLLLALGPVTGLALNVKSLPVLFLAALAATLLAAGPRTVLTRPALWAAAGIALALWAPNLWWQASHGWPQFHKAVDLSGGVRYGTRAEVVPAQFLYLGPPLAFLLVVGLWRAWRGGGVARALGLAYLLVLAVVVAVAGHAYYPMGAMPAVLALGAVAAARWALVPLVVANVVLGAVVALPVVPAGRFPGSVQARVNVDATEMFGWPELAATVAGVYRGLPAGERAAAVILTGNYGEAAAIERYGPALGLPQPYSGHLAYGRWGPPPDSATGPVILVGGPVERWAPYCGSVTPAARHDNGRGIANPEQGLLVHVCRDLRGPWSAIWPRLRHV